MRVVGEQRFIRGLGSDDHELVPTEPPNDCITTQIGSEPLSNSLQELIASNMAQGFVDEFEVIEIGEQHSNTSCVTTR